MDEKPNVHMADAADDLVHQMVLTGIDGPFALLGYSMGATMAYHIYFRLRELAPAPEHVFFMENTPPFSPAGNIRWSEMDDGTFLNKMAGLGGMSQEVLACKELLDVFLPIMRADTLLEEDGQVASPTTIGCDMTIMYSEQDDTAGTMEDWRRCAGGQCEFHRFDGTHFFMLDHYAEVAEIINRTL